MRIPRTRLGLFGPVLVPAMVFSACTAPDEPSDAPGADRSVTSVIEPPDGVAPPARDAGAICDAAVASVGSDASDATDASSGADAGPPTAPPAPVAFDCAAYVEVGQLWPATCAVVDPVSHRVGRLEWICAGGAARLTLGDIELTGSVDGDSVELTECREDPVSWLEGHYETVEVSANLVTMSGVLSFTRASGLSCARVFADCNATAGVVLKQ